jgi:hypothetical protein
VFRRFIYSKDDDGLSQLVNVEAERKALASRTQVLARPLLSPAVTVTPRDLGVIEGIACPVHHVVGHLAGFYILPHLRNQALLVALPYLYGRLPVCPSAVRVVHLSTPVRVVLVVADAAHNASQETLSMGRTLVARDVDIHEAPLIAGSDRFVTKQARNSYWRGNTNAVITDTGRPRLTEVADTHARIIAEAA